MTRSAATRAGELKVKLQCDNMKRTLSQRGQDQNKCTMVCDKEPFSVTISGQPKGGMDVVMPGLTMASRREYERTPEGQNA